ncbi:armadillo-type protein [Lasiosphaeris hirsuta]|uniref:Pumilio homology domain family member 3 n=1 Tax=Lasiosphaeris hirsuta TaxID=260670 RepID=A0AA40A7Y4_9PEZI|nr:armadillo-type protein [Lasiosphaeris hirsuta]
MQAAIGQRGPTRPKATTASDPSTNGFGFSYSDLPEDLFDSEPRLNGYANSKRPSQDTAFLSRFGSTSRDPGMPTSSHSETDMHGQSNPFGEFFGAQTQNASHSQRPSITGPISFPTQTNRPYSHGAGQQADDMSVEEKFRTSLVLSDNQGGTSIGMPALSTYGTAPHLSQFNPMSQPWGPNGPAQTYQTDFAKEAFSASMGFEKRGSITDRNSPAGSTYRAGFSSPKSFTGTPQPAPDTWNRPASRDHRVAPEPERRAPSHQFQAPQTAGYYQNNLNFYNAHAYQQYSSPIYPDPYPGNFRHPVPGTPAYAMAMNPLFPIPNGVPSRPGKDQDPAKGVRSALLEEFRSTSKSNKRFELKNIYNHIVEFSGDQHGSRFIQEKLETANSDEKDQVFREIEPNALQLMKDVFGNYVIQKFFEHGNQVQKKVLAGAMKGKVADLSMQMYACRVVQKALEHILVEQQALLVSELEPDILKVVKDQNGNHVVQKIIELVPRQYIGFIMDCFKGRVSELSSHLYGCRVIQRVLEHGNDEDKTAIMNEIHHCTQMLITDQYGNYVTQHVIQHGKLEDREKVITIVMSQLLTLSKHKFASNVVEKAIEKCTPETRNTIRERLSVVGGEDLNGPLPLMIKDQYGNYVIQKLLSVLKGKERDDFVEVVRPVVMPYKKVVTGRQIAVVDRLITAINNPTPRDNPMPSSITPALPTLQVDIGSAVPTPNLTMGQNSPSSSPPSTNASAVEESVGETVKRASAKLSSAQVTGSPRAGVDAI